MIPGVGPALAGVGVVAGTLLVVASFLNTEADYASPPLVTEQIGFRGLGMASVADAGQQAELIADNGFPAPQIPLDTSGPRASEVYQNVQVLGDLSQGQFTRLMLAITQWVSPQQGCTYCHAQGEGFAADTLYTKRVSRWMIQMTRYVNTEWQDHVGGVGVSCWTCHRGNNVPQYVWFEPEITGAQLGSNAMLGYYKMLYGPSEYAGLASLSQDPLGPYLVDDQQIRVNSTTALPSGNTASTKQTEQTYALMMHMSQSLGVNCTYCHNTRAFSAWDQSPPARLTAWYGIRMVRDLNNLYLNTIIDALPTYRLGEFHGDAPKANCTTCHQGLAKPLNGVSMLGDYPSLAAANEVTREELLPGTLEPMWMPAADQGAAAPAPAGDAAQAPAADATPGTVTEPEASAPAAQSQEAAEDAGLSGVDPAAAAPETATPPAADGAATTPAVPTEAPAAEGSVAGPGEEPAPTQNASPPTEEDGATTSPGAGPVGAEAIEEAPAATGAAPAPAAPATAPAQ